MTTKYDHEILRAIGPRQGVQSALDCVDQLLEIIPTIVRKSGMYGDGTPGSVTRILFDLLWPDGPRRGSARNQSTEYNTLCAALRVLEALDFIEITRQSDPTHAKGDPTGQVGNKITYIRLKKEYML